MDQSSFAAPHGFSQRITSFIACACQGIHQMPFFHLIVLIANAHRLCWIWQTYPPRLRSKGCQIWPSGQLSYAAAAKIRNLAISRPLCAITFTIALSNNAIDVFDMSSQKSRRGDFRAISKTSLLESSGDARSATPIRHDRQRRSEEHPNKRPCLTTRLLPTSRPLPLPGRLDHPWLLRDWARTSRNDLSTAQNTWKLPDISSSAM